MNTLYDEKYFFSDCEGYREFSSSDGIKLSRRLAYVYSKVYEYKPSSVLDLGCGRGELALSFGLSGWDTYGIDYSEVSIEICRKLKERWIKNSPQMKLNFKKADVSNLPFRDESFDAVVMSDLVEHLDEKKLILSYIEAYRVLKPKGKIFIHTSPNKIFLKWGLRLYWLLGFINGVKLPFDMKELLPRGLKKPFHINEQTVFSLKKGLKKAGFSDFSHEFKKNPHYVYYFLKEDKFIPKLNKIYNFIPSKHLFFADIFISASKTKSA